MNEFDHVTRCTSDVLEAIKKKTAVRILYFIEIDATDKFAFLKWGGMQYKLGIYKPV